ncbi:SAVED domain-containing protein [Aureimonas jatrophae]|uniref:SMODS-associated and fused to various effectors domain-containing protein n=1 Tax=Aureimonas jatrophae TaxID=1166073 RepID=A0A1H0JAZ4_9HYPH|nr:SAVED domain-containing protein [Aureimonas jatrophae]MBB3951499.1 hypothetical protein [Aureimonas jatrophae]SDO40918.1 hypothetical protein SAMN05192530_10696 [Aureimonas jatrophae]
MSSSSIPQKTKTALWARAAGRCQYRGCNEDLVGDLVAGREDGTFGFVAHIVADEPGGPRGDPVRSKKLAKDIGNLMLLCGRHHKQIDVDGKDQHDEDMLLSMKHEHEERMAVLTGIDRSRGSHVVRFLANIGKNEASAAKQDIFDAMRPERFPATERTIDLEMTGVTFQDHEEAYWTLQGANLRRQFDAQVRGRIERGEIQHLSVFAIAPQPLLIELGRLLCDIVPARIHQRHREPQTWRWQDDQPAIRFAITECGRVPGGPVALKLALSAEVKDDRIHAVLGKDANIWSVTVDGTPHNDILRREDDQVVFRQHVRRLLDRIKAVHGEQATINVFPALPVSAAVDVGRVWMPKADLPMRIYDQNRGSGGFFPTLLIE